MTHAPGNHQTHHRPDASELFAPLPGYTSARGTRIQASKSLLTSAPDRLGLAIRVTGELDISAAAYLERTLARATGSCGPVLLDLRETSFIDAVALRVIVRGDRRLRESGGRLIVVPGSLAVRRVLRVSGMYGRLEIIDDASRWPLSTGPATALEPAAG